MTSVQDFRQHPHTLDGTTGILFLKRKVQDWICQQIVNDDPCDEETFFPTRNQSDEEGNRQLNLF